MVTLNRITLTEIVLGEIEWYDRNASRIWKDNKDVTFRELGVDSLEVVQVTDSILSALSRRYDAQVALDSGIYYTSPRELIDVLSDQLRIQ